MIAGRRNDTEVAMSVRGLAERNTSAERIVPCIQGIVRDMTEPQHALHVVDYYLWLALTDWPNFSYTAKYYESQCSEAYLDEREMERDKRENW